MTPSSTPPRRVHLDRSRGLEIEWSDGETSFFPTAYLRRMSPSADARHLREELARNPLTVLPSGGDAPLEATSAELVGQYAVRIGFSDGHSTGIYSWVYLRQIDPGPASANA
ncbi:MAG: gamma-butyrobetaine hydroxylase-like domain-containing protein [Phycisphaerales bacterium]|jgi:DUF971 family protein